MKYFFASLDMTQHSIFDSIEHALRYFGGSPCELLSDNAKQMVTNADPKNFKWNEKYTTFLGYYGIDPKACKVRHPYTKGKVENPFKYLENHFIKGNSFESFKDLFTSLESFTHKVNKKNHEGINGIPWDRFEEEKKYLQHLPELNYIGIHEEWRKVTFDCLVSFEGNKYSVPYPYASKSVWVRSHRGFYVQIFAQSGKLIATHQKPKGKGHILTNNRHYDGLRKSNPETVSGMKDKFLSLFPEYELFIDKLQASKRLNFKTHLSKIIPLSNIYAIDDIKKALKSAIEVNVLSFDYIFAYLSGNCDIEQRALVKMNNKENLDSNEEVFRNLSYYDSIQ